MRSILQAPSIFSQSYYNSGETVTCAFIAILAILPRIGVALHESDQGLAGRTDDGPNDEDIKRATITINLLRGQRGESEMVLGRVVDTD